MHPREQLAHVLESLFGDDELRRFFAYGYPRLERDLPGRAASRSELFAAAVRSLEQHGLIDEVFFTHLLDARPAKRAEIDRLRDVWTTRPADPPGVALPGSYAPLVDELTRGFVGRDHIFGAFAQFESRLRSDRRGGYFALLGGPGEGKSAIVARLAQQRGCVVHFNQATTGNNTLRAFHREMHRQLAGLPGARIPQPTGDAMRDGSWLLDALTAVRRDSAEDLVVAVDALDEVDEPGPLGANPLFLPRYLPAGVHVFVTRRPHGAPLLVDCVDERSLGDYPDDNRRDVGRYIEQFAAKEDVDRWLMSRSIPTRRFVEVLLERSQENFMYLHHVLPMFAGRDHARADLELGELPRGLTAYYGDHWRRMGMVGADASRHKLKILYVLAELRAPVTRAILAEVCETSALDVQRVLDEWRAFLRLGRADGEVLYSLYHLSFQDFLRKQPTLEASGVDLQQVNRWIARWSLEGIPLDD